MNKLLLKNSYTSVNVLIEQRLSQGQSQIYSFIIIFEIQLLIEIHLSFSYSFLK